MTNFIEIGGLIKKGLGHSVVERFSKNIDVISIGYANGRSSDLFDIQQFGSASEAEILTIIVKGRKSNAIFDELYNYAGWEFGEYKALKEVFREDEYIFKAFNTLGHQVVIQIK